MSALPYYSRPGSLTSPDIYIGIASMLAGGYVSLTQAYDAAMKVLGKGVSFSQAKLRNAVDAYTRLPRVKRLAVDAVATTAVYAAGADPRKLASVAGFLHDAEPASIVRAAETAAFNYIKAKAPVIASEIPKGLSTYFNYVKHSALPMSPALPSSSSRGFTPYNLKRKFEQDILESDIAAKRLNNARGFSIPQLGEHGVYGSASDWDLARKTGSAEGQTIAKWPGFFAVDEMEWEDFKKKWPAMEAQGLRRGAYRRRINRYLAGLSKYYR